MAKRAHINDTVDPTRAKLAALASAPAAPPLPDPAEGEHREGTNPVLGNVWRGPVSKARKRERNYLTVNRKVMISEDEAARFAEATSLISFAFGSRVTYSQVTRALWALTCAAEDAIREGAQGAPKLPVPSKGNHVAMAEYEQALADFLEVAIKRLRRRKAK